MPLGLHNLQKSKGATKKRKRVGRGDGSGKGTYSGRGLKGQKARSGGKSGSAARAAKAYIFKTPKVKGFKSLKNPPVAVTLEMLEKAFDKGEVITHKKLANAGIIKKTTKQYKIIAKGNLTKNFTVKAHAFSGGAKEAIEKAGGQIEKLSLRLKKQVSKK